MLIITVIALGAGVCVGRWLELQQKPAPCVIQNTVWRCHNVDWPTKPDGVRE